MSTPEVSVIMAAYNAQNTICRAIESFQKQTLSDWELIVIDDGSTDKTSKILDDFQAGDSRIRVIHTVNRGVAAARQTGIEHSSGVFTIHADADDWVENNMLERMYSHAIENNSDMTVADYYVNHLNGKQEKICQKLDSNRPEDVIFQLYAKNLFGGLWHKLIKKTVYDNEKVCFDPTINFCEDKLLLTKILYLNPNLRISYLPEAFYHYEMTLTSITRKITQKQFDSMKRFQLAFPQYLPKQERFNHIIELESLRLFLGGFIHKIFSPKEIKREFAKVKKEAFKTKSLRWFFGYICIDLHLYKFARNFIKY